MPELLHASFTARFQDQDMDIVAVVIGVAMFALLLILVEGVDRI